MRYKFIKTTA